MADSAIAAAVDGATPAEIARASVLPPLFRLTACGPVSCAAGASRVARARRRDRLEERLRLRRALDVGDGDPGGFMLVVVERLHGRNFVVHDETIYDMREESGAQEADWATEDGDFGCDDSPDTIYPGDDPEHPEDGGMGSHEPEED